MLTDWNTIRSVKYANQIVKTRTDGSHPKIIEFYRHFNDELRARGYPFYAFEFLRSNARSDRLFKQGVSKAKGGQSPHNYGCAVDIVHCTKYWDLTRTDWELIGAIGKIVAAKRKIKIVWGGDFKSIWDPAHWELANWRDMRTAQREIQELLDHRNRNRLPENHQYLPKDDEVRFALFEEWIRIKDPKHKPPHRKPYQLLRWCDRVGKEGLEA